MDMMGRSRGPFSWSAAFHCANAPLQACTSYAPLAERGLSAESDRLE